MTTTPATPPGTLIGPRTLWITTGILVTLMVAGSIWDYALSQILFAPSSTYGAVFAAFGEAPAFLALVMASALLIRHRNRERTVIGVLQIIAATFLLALGSAAAAYMPSRYLEASPVLLAAIGLALVAGTFVATWRLSAQTSRRTAMRLALILFLVPFIEILLVNIVKIFWERPRMRMIEATPDAHFMSWWMPGFDGKDALMSAGIEGEEFKSFPSGHTANAAVAMMLAMFARMSDTLRPRANLLFAIGLVWALLVALSRIIMGAHFLTDVTMGLTLTFLTILIADRLAFGAPSKEITA